jgi:hypothetical protein
LPDVVADWKEPSREGLCPLGADVTSVVFDSVVFNVDVLQTKRNDRAISGAGQDRESDKRPGAPLDIRDAFGPLFWLSRWLSQFLGRIRTPATLEMVRGKASHRTNN